MDSTEKERVVDRFPRKPDQLLAVLIALQDNNPQNYLSEEDLDLAARHVNVTKARVYGVTGYYSMLSTVPRGRHILRVCRSPVCRMVGGDAVESVLVEQLKVDPGGTTADRAVTLEHTECLGRCHQAPVIMIDATVHGPVDGKKATELAGRLQQGERS